MLTRNLRAQFWLGLRAGNLRGFACFGRFRLTLDAAGIISGAENQLGIVHLASTPIDATTCIGVERDAALDLNGFRLGRGSSLVVRSGARLSIGRGTYITDGSRVVASNAITIGRDCAISFGVTVIDEDGHGLGSGPVVLEDHVLVGCKATILKGVTIGSGSIVAAGSVVTRGCPSRSLLAGVPASVVRENVSWS